MDRNKIHLIACYAAFHITERMSVSSIQSHIDSGTAQNLAEKEDIEYGIQEAKLPISSKDRETINAIINDVFFKETLSKQIKMIFENIKLY